MPDSSSISENEIQSDHGDDDDDVVAVKDADAMETPASKRPRKNDTVTASDTPKSAASAHATIQISSSDEEDETPIKTPVQCVHSRLCEMQRQMFPHIQFNILCILPHAVLIYRHHSSVSLRI